MPRSLSIDTNGLTSCGVNIPPNNLGSDDASLRIGGVGVEMFCADYRGLFHEQPLTTVSIFEFALDNARLGFVANVADYGHPDSKHRTSSHNECNWDVTTTIPQGAMILTVFGGACNLLNQRRCAQAPSIV